MYHTWILQYGNGTLKTGSVLQQNITNSAQRFQTTFHPSSSFVSWKLMSWEFKATFPIPSLHIEGQISRDYFSLPFRPGQISRWRLALGGVPLDSHDTVDGSEFLHHLRCIKPCRWWGRFSISDCLYSQISEPSTLYFSPIFEKMAPPSKTFPDLLPVDESLVQLPMLL